jgi:hypothetical protein
MSSWTRISTSRRWTTYLYRKSDRKKVNPRTSGRPCTSTSKGIQTLKKLCRSPSCLVNRAITLKKWNSKSQKRDTPRGYRLHCCQNNKRQCLRILWNYLRSNRTLRNWPLFTWTTRNGGEEPWTKINPRKLTIRLFLLNSSISILIESTLWEVVNHRRGIYSWRQMMTVKIKHLQIQSNKIFQLRKNWMSNWTPLATILDLLSKSEAPLNKEAS